MPHRIIVLPEARAQFDAIYDKIAGDATPDIARRFTDGIASHLDTLVDYPRIGTPRDDLRAGLRTLVHRRRVTIAFVVEPAVVVVIGFFYAGQDVEGLLRDDH